MAVYRASLGISSGSGINFPCDAPERVQTGKHIRLFRIFYGKLFKMPLRHLLDMRFHDLQWITGSIFSDALGQRSGLFTLS